VVSHVECVAQASNTGKFSRSDAQPGALAGRVENLVTGQSREFASGGELLESIAEDLETNDEAKP